MITVLTSPYPEVDGVKQKFSCAWNCHYCPAEPGQPRSYLHEEPAVRRANQNGFDAVLQFTDRCGVAARRPAAAAAEALSNQVAQRRNVGGQRTPAG